MLILSSGLYQSQTLEMELNSLTLSFLINSCLGLAGRRNLNAMQTKFWLTKLILLLAVISIFVTLGIIVYSENDNMSNNTITKEESSVIADKELQLSNNEKIVFINDMFSQLNKKYRIDILISDYSFSPMKNTWLNGLILVFNHDFIRLLDNNNKTLDTFYLTNNQNDVKIIKK